MNSRKHLLGGLLLFLIVLTGARATAKVASPGADPIPQSITFSLGTDANKIYGNEPFDLSATGGNSGNEVLFTSSDLNVATIEGNTVTIVGAGTATITASQAGNNEYSAAVDVTQLLTVSKADQFITFDDIGQKILGQDVNFTLSAFSSSGLAVDYTSSNASVATVANSTVMILSPGETIIAAIQEGDNNYNPADPVSRHMIVVPGDIGGGGGEDQSQVILFSLGDNATRVYGDGGFLLEALGGGSGNPVTFVSTNQAVAVIDGTSVSIVGAGTTQIIASQAGGSGFLPASDVEQTLVVNKADQFITFSPMDPIALGGEPVFSPNAYASSELPVEYTSSNTAVATVTSDGLALLSYGETTITASQPGNENYNAAGEVSYVLIVLQGPQPQFITFSLGADANKIYGDQPFTLSASGGDSGNRIEFTSSDPNVATIEGDVVTIVGAGTTSIIASQGASNEYLQADDVEQLLTVAKADQSIMFEGIDQKEIGRDGPFSLNAYASSGLLLEFTSSNTEVADVANGIVTFVAQGETTITAIQNGDNNYNPAQPVSNLLIVVQGDFGGGGGGDGGNGGVEDQEQFILFSLGEHAVKVYGDAGFQLEALGGPSGNSVTFVSLNPEVATIEGTTVNIVGAGTAVIIASQAGAQGYFPANDVDQTLIVNKAEQSILFDPLVNKTLGDAPITINATASSGLPISYLPSSSDKVTLDVNVVTLVTAGRVSITAEQGGGNNFHAASPVEQSFCINPPKPSITLAGENTGTPTLTSSSSVGNQWFKDGTAISDATGTTFTALTEGVYTVQVTVDDCESDVSEAKNIIVMSVTRQEAVRIRAYPNPVVDFLHIDGVGPGKQWSMSDLLAKDVNVPVETYGTVQRADVRGLNAGMYVIRISDGANVQLIKVIKQ